MRRALSAFAIVSLTLVASCAAPAIHLDRSYDPGTSRIYSLRVTATTDVDVGELKRTETTTLEGTSRIDVVAVAGDEITLRLTMTPARFTRDGRDVGAPSPQTAELIVGRDGAVRRVGSVGGLPASIGGSPVEDLAPLLGAPLPSGRVRLGQRWTRILAPSSPEDGAVAVQPGRQRGLVTALRSARGHDCVILTLGTERPLVRERALDERTVRLAGTESSTSRIAFAFREGYPVEISTRAHATLAVQSGTLSTGTVTISSDTTLALLD